MWYKKILMTDNIPTQDWILKRLFDQKKVGQRESWIKRMFNQKQVE